MENNIEKKRTCFIVTPIGNEGSSTRRHTDGVIESVIKPLLENEEYDFEVLVAHEIHKTGSITNQVFENVVHSDLVIANVSELNANVMYELGVRHAVRKPVITICEHGTNLPFDITTDRTIKYHNDMQGSLELKERIKKMLDEIDFDELVTDNPVLNGLKIYELTKDMSEKDKYQSLLLELVHKVDKISLSNQHENSPKIPSVNIKDYYEMLIINRDFENDDIIDVDKVLSIFNDGIFDVIEHSVSARGLLIKVKNNTNKTSTATIKFVNNRLSQLDSDILVQMIRHAEISST